MLHEFRGDGEPSIWINWGYFVTTKKASKRNCGVYFKYTGYGSIVL